MWVHILVIGALLIFSAFFSGSETSLFSLPKLRLQTLAKRGRFSTFFALLYKSPRKVLITILISNMFVNIFSSTYAEPTIQEILHSYLPKFCTDIISILLMTFAILIIGEILPKAIAIKKNEEIALFVAPFIYLAYYITMPFRYIVEKILDNFIDFFEEKIPWLSKNIVTREDISFYIETAHKSGLLNDKEEEFLGGFVELTEKKVVEIMTPRDEIAFLDFEMSSSEVEKFISKRRFSRYPVFKEDKDNIVGILYLKDFITHKFEKNFKWQNVIREPYIVPETKKAFSLFKEFKEKRIHIAIVVDEYGIVSGIVTFEDILEELFGAQKDLHKELKYEKIDDNSFIFSARIPLEDFSEIMDIEIEDEDEDEVVTLGGFLLMKMGKLPKMGETFEYKNLHFEIIDADKKKINKIKVIKKNKKC